MPTIALDLYIVIIFLEYCQIIVVTTITIILEVDWTIGVLGFDSRRGLEIFLFTTASRTALGLTQPPTQWYQGLFPWG
jgi:hypothetical protein